MVFTEMALNFSTLQPMILVSRVILQVMGSGQHCKPPEKILHFGQNYG